MNGPMRLGLFCLLGVLAFAAPADPLRHVNPFIGTGGHGHTFPGPSLPFGMVQLSPDTRLSGWDGCSGYHDRDRVIFGFSHTHLSGTGCSDYGDILLLPATGAVKLRSGYRFKGEEPLPRDPSGYGSAFRKETEKAEAGYYAVELDDSKVKVELTTTVRSGLHRYTFPGGPAHVLVDLTHRDEVLESNLRIAGPDRLEGMRRSKAWAKDQVVYFVARFSRPFTKAELAVGGRIQPGLRAAEGKDLQAALHWDTQPGERVLVKVGISAVDLEGARRNLDAEQPGFDFEGVRAKARAAWRRELSRVEIEGGSADQRTVFYTALYHAFLQPNVFQDVDGRYRGMDGKPHRAEQHVQHTVFSLWDTFRAAHPLYTILQRRRSLDFIQTFLAQYREGGRLPVWELGACETDCMIGYHSVPVILDAWTKGIRGFDEGLALEAMKASASADRAGLKACKAHGYIPADQGSESVSRTLEYAYDDWCIARFAELTGQPEDAKAFYRRAQAWQHLMDPQGFLRPRDNGRWAAPFDPREVTLHYTEANAWQYGFFVPHDLTAFIGRLGGAAALERHLDRLFTEESRTTGREQVDITGLVGQYAHGNEPSHHMAYLYAYAGAAPKAQAMARRLMDTMYRNAPDGLIGNEDCGQMSAWFVLSALGFYPVVPGRPEYVLGTPLFPKATLRLENGKAFVIRAANPSPQRAYVQGAKLNGRSHSRSWLTHEALLAGGELAFELGGLPSKWGCAAEHRPHSSSPGGVVPAPVAEAVTPFQDRTTVTLKAADPADVLRYTLDGADPDAGSPKYQSPIPIQATTKFRFRAFRGSEASPIVECHLVRLDPKRKLALRSPAHAQYQAGGENALIDGLRGSEEWRIGRWQGFYGIDLQAEVDHGEVVPLHRISVGFLQDQDSWIFMPLEVRFETSVDGVHWLPAGTARNAVDPRAEGVQIREFAISLQGVPARFMRLVAKSPVNCPDWHKGHPNRCFIFADEIRME
jgi:predicted alpha-1,2-mannosidase